MIFLIFYGGAPPIKPLHQIILGLLTSSAESGTILIGMHWLEAHFDFIVAY